MAKTMHTIEMEFQNARRQADELEQISKSLSMLADSSFQSCLAGIAAAWKGENAAAFCKKGNLVGNNVKNTAQDLKHVARPSVRLRKILTMQKSRIMKLPRPGHICPENNRQG